MSHFCHDESSSLNIESNLMMIIAILLTTKGGKNEKRHNPQLYHGFDDCKPDRELFLVFIPDLL